MYGLRGGSRKISLLLNDGGRGKSKTEASQPFDQQLVLGNRDTLTNSRASSAFKKPTTSNSISSGKSSKCMHAGSGLIQVVTGTCRLDKRGHAKLILRRYVFESHAERCGYYKVTWCPLQNVVHQSPNYLLFKLYRIISCT